jgi:hypothetical protein
MKYVLAFLLFISWHGESSPDPETHQWFDGLKQPGTGLGSCSIADCVVLSDGVWRETDQNEPGFQVKDQGEWEDVPKAVVLYGKYNPMSGPVLCRVGGQVAYFVCVSGV